MKKLINKAGAVGAAVGAAALGVAGDANAALDLTGVTIDLTPFETIAALVLVALGWFFSFRICKRVFDKAMRPGNM